MAESSSITPPSDGAGRPAIAKGVADDMAAIFGPALRDTPAPSVVAVRPAARRTAMAALAVGGLAAIIGAGVMAGGSVAGVSATATADAGQAAARRTPARPAPSIAVAGPAAPVPSPVTTSAPVSQQVAGVAPPSAMPSNTESRLRRADRAVPPAPVRPIVMQPVADDRPPATFGDEDAFLDARLDAAERDIADAYAEAAEAGVRNRILRGYRNEWRRARDESASRPHETLRLYAMMTSDLHNLSTDAMAARRPDWR